MYDVNPTRRNGEEVDAQFYKYDCDLIHKHKRGTIKCLYCETKNDCDYCA